MVLAEGATPQRAAALTGYAPTTIAQLSGDPTFRELIAHYRTQTMAEYEDIRRRAASLGLSFLDELQERLEASPEEFSSKELMTNASALLDRTILPSKASGPLQAPPAQPTRILVEFVDAPAPRTLEPLDITPLLQAEPKA